LTEFDTDDNLVQQVRLFIPTPNTHDDVKDTKSSKVEIYFKEGYGVNYWNYTTIKFTPTFYKITPHEGSFGGTEITVLGAGFGINTIGLNLINFTTNQKLCKEVKVVSYGKFTCMTN